jgi:hypothetical protein
VKLQQYSLATPGKDQPQHEQSKLYSLKGVRLLMATTPTYDNTLFDFVHYNGSNADTFVFAEFKKLRRLNLVELQNELAALKGAIYTAGKVTSHQRKELRQLLREYSRYLPTRQIYKLISVQRKLFKTSNS